MQKSNRLGCISGVGFISAVITSLIIAGFVFARGGLLYNPGPLNAQSGVWVGGVTSHAEIGGNCKACHTAPWESARMADRCMDCHTNITSEMQNATSLHGKLLHDNPDLTCRYCHPEHRGANAQLTVIDISTFPHDIVGFSLTGHPRTASQTPFRCDDCHLGDITTFTLGTCQTCHNQLDASLMQVHETAFGADCLACHDGVDRYGNDFNHNRFAFQLAGKHTEIQCTDCHINARNAPDLQSLSQDCFSCHSKDDLHEGRFGSDCATCHTTAAWKPAKFDHNLASFKLEGKHQKVECDTCHINGVYKGTPTDCFSCHQKDDKHAGTFGTDCSACHQPSSWENVTFDHSKSNFPLTGQHITLACEKCHQNNQFTTLPTACVGCHVDPAYHAGMFGTDCTTCHTTNNWSTRYTGPHPAIADEGGRGINHGNTICQTCHTQNLRAATCTACHDSNNPEGGGGGEGGD